MEDQKEIQPNIVMPHKLVLVGAIYGFNAGRKFVPSNIPVKSIFNDREVTNEDFYMGNWLHVECVRCGYVLTFDNPNEIPENNLSCPGECGNYLIIFGEMDPKKWRVGTIRFA